MHSSSSSSLGSLRRSNAVALAHSSTRLAQIQEESKYSKSHHQQGRRILLISLLMCLAFIGLYHIVVTAVRLSLSIALKKETSYTNQKLMAATTDDVYRFPPASLRRTKPDDYYFQAQHAHQDYHHQQLPHQPHQQQPHLSRQERIDQAIQNLKEYQADKDARDADFQQEIKAQIQHDLEQQQKQHEGALGKV
jgi:hypothetical protein